MTISHKDAILDQLETEVTLAHERLLDEVRSLARRMDDLARRIVAQGIRFRPNSYGDATSFALDVDRVGAALSLAQHAHRVAMRALDEDAGARCATEPTATTNSASTGRIEVDERQS